MVVGLVLGRRRPIRRARSQAAAPVAAVLGVALVLGVLVAPLTVDTPPATAQGIPCPATIGELELNSTLEGTDPANGFVICRYVAADGSFDRLSPVSIAIRWTVDPALTDGYGCGGAATGRQETGEMLDLYTYSTEWAALAKRHHRRGIAVL